MNRRRRNAFTLIELLVVISIVIVLIGLAFPAFQAVQNAAKKTQAKNDLLQIVTAVNAFYTEYGKYPIDPSLAAGDVYYGPGPVPAGITVTATSDKLFDVLTNRATNPTNATVLSTLNPRGIIFISPADVKTPSAPKGGIGISGTGAPTPLGQFYDPWGKAYSVVIDATYDKQVANPYSQNAGAAPLSLGVISWSLGRDGLTSSTNKSSGTAADDVISWQ